MTTNEQVRLDGLNGTLSIQKGFPTQRSTPQGQMPVMSISALRDNTAPTRYADPVDMAQLGLEPVGYGVVLVAVEGGSVGETYIVPEGTDEFIPSQQAVALKALDPDLLDPWYLAAWMMSPRGQEQVRRLARGVNVRRITFKDFGSVMVELPPIAVQREIGQRFAAFENSIQAHQAVLRCLEDIRDIDLITTFAKSDRVATGRSL